MSLLEMAAAAGRTGQDDSNNQTVCIIDTAFAGSLAVSSSLEDCNTVLDLSLNTLNGVVDVTSSTANVQTHVKHLMATLTAVNTPNEICVEWLQYNSQNPKVTNLSVILFKMKLVHTARHIR